MLRFLLHPTQMVTVLLECVTTEISAVAAELLQVMVGERTRTSAIEQERIDLGPVVVGLSARAAAPISDPELSGLANRTVGVAFTGIFDLFAKAMRFACSHERVDCVAVLKALRGEWAYLYVVPEWISVHVPMPVDRAISPSRIADDIAMMSDIAFKAGLGDNCLGSHALSRWPLVFYMFGMDTRQDSSDEGVRRLVDLLSDREGGAFGISVWATSVQAMYNEGVRDASVLWDPELMRVVISALRRCPAGFRHLHPMSWGRMLAMCTDSEEREWLRRSLCDATAGETLEFESFREYLRVEDAFPIRLPEECNLLVRIISRTVAVYASADGRDYIGRYGSRPPRDDVKRVCAQLMMKYVENVTSLIELADDDTIREDVRAAALLSAVLHRDGGSVYAIQRGERLVEWCARGSRVGIGLALCAEVLSLEDDRRIRVLLSQVLEASDEVGAEEWAGIVSRWRERSRAPVSQGGLVERWLRTPDE